MSDRLLIRGGCVLTLGARTPNYDRADVLVEEGKVVEIDRGLRARDAEVIDASDCIVMPGFVDAHRHLWKTLYRNAGELEEVIPDESRLGPDDVYAATLAGLLGAVEAGITTVVDFADIPGDPGLWKASIEAHRDAGVRTVLVHAPSVDGGDTSPLAGLRRLVEQVSTASDPTTALAYGSADLTPRGLDVVAEEWAEARSLGLRIHAHGGGSQTHHGAIAQAGSRGLLGGDVTLAHCTTLGSSDLGAIASSRTGVVLTPQAEMATGVGIPPIQEMMSLGIRPGLGVGDERLGPGDLFAQMRTAISIQHATHFDLKLAGKGFLPQLMTTREVIKYATYDGALAIGLGEVSGSLEPGKSADIVVLRADRPNIAPVNDPIGAVVWGMDTSNFDWVLVAGRVLLREGVLEADIARVRELANRSRRRLYSATGEVANAVAGGGS